MKTIQPSRDGERMEAVVHGFLGAATLLALLAFFGSLVQVSDHRTEIARAFERWSTVSAPPLLAGGLTNQAAPAAASATTVEPQSPDPARVPITAAPPSDG